MEYKILKNDLSIIVEGNLVKNNKIKTTKYNVYNILPLSIFYQFTNLLYIYFLIAGILVIFFGDDPYDFLSYLFPLLFVIIVSLIRDYLREYKLYKNNKEINNKPVKKFKNNEFINSTFQELEQGDIIEINNNNIIPADILILCSKNNKSSTYIGTSNLDGEKSLKVKKFNPDIKSYINEINFNFSNFHYELTITKPNVNLKDFTGNLKFKNKTIKFNHQQYFPRDSKLKDDILVYALVVYVGHETKIMLKTNNKINKKSKLEKNLNFYVISNLWLQLFLMIFTFVLNYINNKFYFGFIFSNYTNQNIFIIALINALRYMISLSGILSTSLAVTIELLKDLLSLLLYLDENLVDKKKNIRHKIYSEDIIEDLGQIEYLLSDKTGTLTINKMELIYLNIGFHIYNTNYTFKSNKFDSLIVDNIIINKELFKTSKYPIKLISIDNADKLELKNIEDEIFLFVFSLLSCHNLIMINKNNKLKFNGESQEEISIIKKLNKIGIIIQDIDENIIKILLFNQEIIINKICIIEFDNIRKMMSSLVNIKFNNKSVNILFSKGADSSIYQRICNQESDLFLSIKSFTKYFSEKGLRSLTYGYRLLSGEEVKRFVTDYDNYNNKIDLNSIFKWENNLYLSGNVYIEDKILPNINKTIEYFKHADIKCWILTGDKLETTVSISLTCGIINNIKELLIIDNMSNLNNFLEKKNGNITSIILHGSLLSYIFDNFNIKINFFEKIKNLESCLFCRWNPFQKKSIAEYLKSKNKVVAAIGDGANDIPMLQISNIGIGIFGKEGEHAANNSDFGISNFNKLKSLIFYHGRLSYLKISKTFLYYFYKNIVYVFSNILYGFFSGFTSYEYFPILYSQLYNIILTSLNFVPRALYEQDITNYKIISKNKKKCCISNNKVVEIDKNINWYFPYLYDIGKNDKIFNYKIFFTMLVYSSIESILSFFIVKNSFYNYNNDLIINSLCLQNIIILNVNIKLFFKTNLISLFHILTILFTSILLNILFLYVLDNSIIEIYKTFNSYATNWTFYIVIILNFGIIIIINLLIKTFNTILFPSEVQIIKEFIKNKLYDFAILKKLIVENDKRNKFHQSFINKY